MGFDLNGNTVTASTGLAFTSVVGNLLQKLGTTGILQRYSAGHTMFRAGATGTAASVSVGTAGTWGPIIFPAVNVNVGSCYSGATGRFTAPVAGMYLFCAATYCNNAAAWYVHSMFWVNGSSSVRRPNSAGGYHRLHMHGITAGYSADTEACEMIPLLAGDYVQFYNTPSVAGTTHIPQYGHFEGYLLG